MGTKLNHVSSDSFDLRKIADGVIFRLTSEGGNGEIYPLANLHMTPSGLDDMITALQEARKLFYGEPKVTVADVKKYWEGYGKVSPVSNPNIYAGGTL